MRTGVKTVIKTLFIFQNDISQDRPWRVYLNHTNNDTGNAEMNYEQVKAEYIKNFNAMMGYTPEQVGAGVFAEKMADLEEAYPEWIAIIEEAA